MSHTLPCIVCGVALTTAFARDEEGGQPSAGTIFLSYGNYGSTVYDPGGGERYGGREYLKVHICDQCLLEAGKLGSVRLMVRHVLPEQYESSMWDGDGLEWCAPCGRAVLADEHGKHDDGSGVAPAAPREPDVMS